MKTYQCPKCGTGFKLNTKFCQSCGFNRMLMLWMMLYLLKSENRIDMGKSIEAYQGTICPKCGVGSKLNTRFCQNCGCNLETEFIEKPTCPACHKTFATGTRFCDRDGSKLVSINKLTHKCAKCSREYPEDVKFCPEDGEKITSRSLEVLKTKKNYTDKTILRIISKAGLVMVIIGFFMPISCNLNGFQIAQYTSYNGINPLSMSLYGIFVFSVIGAILLLLLIMKKSFSISWDWFSVIGAIASATIVFIKMDGGQTGSGVYSGNTFQYGAYIILLGLIISIMFIFMASLKKEDEDIY